METKEKIINSAEELFGIKGFNGASIREISKHSSVNIAAINYHFASKENLYLEVLKLNRIYLDNQIRKICLDELDVEDCVLKIFNLFVKNGDKVLLTFKYFMSEFEFEDLSVITSKNGNFGPPGFDLFLEFLTNKFPKKNKDYLSFVTKNLFSVICHNALALSCPGIGKHLSKSKNYNLKIQQENLIQLTKVLVGV